MDDLEGIQFTTTLEELRKDLPVLRKYYPVAAEALRAYYCALVNVQFTPEQALEIVKAHGFNPGSSAMGKYVKPLEASEE